MVRTKVEWVLLVSLSLLPACLQGVGSESDQPGTSDLATATPGALAASKGGVPKLVASLKVSSGSTVEIYDFGGSAMISEVGAAYTSSALNGRPDLQGARPIDIWTALAPNTPVPTTLKAFQSQLDNASAAASSGSQPDTVAAGIEVGAPTGNAFNAIPDTAVGCNNGCCDAAWLGTLFPCNATGWSYEWFLYNYGSTYVNSNNIDTYIGFVCSAVGTSTYKVNMGGVGGAWSVPEATWRTWSHGDNGCWFSCDNMTSTVNTATNQHLHTYCGVVDYF